MTIGMVKKMVKDNKGIEHNFRFKSSRNQTEEFGGKITGVYPAIFIITMNDSKIRSFSYSDLLIDNLEIID